MVSEKICEVEDCNEVVVDNSPTKNKKYCSRKCSKAAAYQRNKGTWVAYEAKNREKINKRSLDNYHKNKEVISQQRRDKYKADPQPRKDRANKYRLDNPEKTKIRKKKYGIENRDKTNKKHNFRYATDELYKLRFTVRNRLRRFLQDKGWNKDCHTSQVIGCTFEELKIYLEQQFTKDMTWKNHGAYWHIDHIVPLASALTKEEVYTLSHYSNLQPLTIEENLKKGAKY